MAERYRFLQKDYDRLDRKVDQLGDEMLRVGGEMATWASQSAETWHDNFGYEEGVRQEDMLATRSEDFERLRAESEIVSQGSAEVVDVGSEVVLEDEKGSRRRFIVSSYLVLDRRDEREVSYAAPLVAPLLGAAVGEERSVTVPAGEQLWRVVSIEAADLARLNGPSDEE